MELNVDNRKSDAMYVDKELSHTASKEELFKVMTKDCANSLRLTIDMFAGVFKLNESEADVLYYITYLSKSYGFAIINKVKDVFQTNSLKSVSTFNRAIESLRKKNIVHLLKDGKYISVNNRYYIDVDKIDKASFIVIEVKPQVTSQAVDLL